MNTDNMSILGETFDFGPFGFLDEYNPGFICNHSDHSGRYAFNNQPSIGLWNCHALAAALKDYIEIERTKEIISSYENIFYNELNKLYRKKLGLFEEEKDDLKLVEELLTWMKDSQKDYTNTLRSLSVIDESFFDKTGKAWFKKYQERLIRDSSSEVERKTMMNEANPKYVLRNYLAQEAIQAAENGDLSALNLLIEVLKNPYTEDKKFDKFSEVPPEWAKKIEISCSS